jgi:fructosamine-3-kinase
MTDAVRAELERAFGPLRAVHAIAGGCISPSFRIVLADKSKRFVKTATRGWPPEAFAAEAQSLEALRATGTLVVPRVHGCGASWLALDWLEPVRATDGHWAELGRGLARLHRNVSDYGWPSANFLGPIPQTNERSANWPEFWREQRLRPLFERAAAQLDRAAVRDFERLFAQLDDLLAPASAEGASLLHGDLWNGNVHMCTDGAGVIDPASYYGHREVDLAMAVLFGGFPPTFHEAYEREWAVLPGASVRQPIYQLYYLLAHVVLFGGVYVRSTMATLQVALGRG